MMKEILFCIVRAQSGENLFVSFFYWFMDLL